METIFLILGTCGLAAVFPILYRSRDEIRRTSLRTAWTWMVPAVLMLAMVWGTTVLTSIVEGGVADRLWYLCSVLMLCPPIAVLGARRPGLQAWNWFVLVPLVLVLGFPAMALRGSGSWTDSLQMELPAAIGFGLVLVMGAGNYCGTRFTLSAGLSVIALILTVGSVTSSISELFPSTLSCRIWGTICLSAAFITAACRSKRSFPTTYRMNQIWIDFRDDFGIVWSRRIMDRINRIADEEHWPVRLDLHGFLALDGTAEAELSQQAIERVEQVLRWHLRRFVEPEWIDRRLKTAWPC